ncbi:MAG: hypothetical protein LQ352_007499, partial [Teloschistes flavicans]
MTAPPTSQRPLTTGPSSPSTTPPTPPYRLHYWPGVPGRGEPIRLCFEATQTPYTDVPNRGEGMSTLASLISPTSTGTGATNPPHFAPPVLEHGDLFISQLPNILLYLGPQLGLAGAAQPPPPQQEAEVREGNANAIYHINQLALTALDGFVNEVHETHHPIAVSLYYEDQIPAAKTRARDYLTARLPKFLAYFERALASPASQGGEYLHGGRLT